MFYLKRSCIFLILFVLAFASYSGDSLHINSFNSIQLLNTENLWLKTGNSAGLFFNQKKELLTFDVGTTLKNGEFHLIREGGDIDNYSLNASSYKSIGDRIFVSGKFSYNYLNEKGAQWCGTYDPYTGNPYLLADSLSGSFWHKENYRLAGQMAYALSEKWILGCGVDYLVAVAAKQKDPRPENIFTWLEINPSVILKKDNYKLGFDIGYRNWKEEINYTIERSNFNATYFTFKGYGFYSKEIDYSYYRFQYGSEMFGGLQFEKDLSGKQSLTEIRFNYSMEGIEDGGSTIVKEDGGDWMTYKVELREKIKKTTGRNIHLFEGNASFFNGDGTEYTQERIKDGDNYRYVTISKNLKFNRQVISGNIAYNYLVKLDDNKIGWDIKTAVHVVNNSETYYYIPEIFNSAYLNVSGLAEVQKNFYLGNIQLAPSFNASYTANLSNNLDLSNLAEITKNQRPEVYTQEFNYYTTNVMKIGGKIQLGYSPRSIKTIDQINLSLLIDFWKPSDFDSNMTNFIAKIGFVF